jgi:hypothetical protein
MCISPWLARRFQRGRRRLNGCMPPAELQAPMRDEASSRRLALDRARPSAGFTSSSRTHAELSLERAAEPATAGHADPLDLGRKFG